MRFSNFHISKLVPVLLLLPVRVFAQSQNPPGQLNSIVTGPMASIATIAGYGSGAPASPYDLVGAGISLAIGLVGVIFLVVAIYGGFQWMTAGGNEQRVSEAKNRLQNGVIGVVIVFAAYILTSAMLYEVCQFTGVLCS